MGSILLDYAKNMTQTALIIMLELLHIFLSSFFFKASMLLLSFVAPAAPFLSYWLLVFLVLACAIGALSMDGDRRRRW